MTERGEHRLLEEAVRRELERLDWRVASQSFFGRPDLVLSHPDGSLLLVEIKSPSDRVRFSQIAQLAEWRHLTNSVDQVTRALVLLVTDGEVAPSVAEYARKAGVTLVQVAHDLDIGNQIAASLA